MKQFPLIILSFLDSMKKRVCLYFDEIFEQKSNEYKFHALLPHIDKFLSDGNHNAFIINHGVTGNLKITFIFMH